MKVLKLIGLTVLLAAGITAVNAQVPNSWTAPPYQVFGGYATNNTNAILYVSANSDNGGAPVLTSMQFQLNSLNSNALVRVYAAGPGRAITNAAPYQTNIVTCTTSNGITVGDPILIRYVTNDTYRKMYVTSVTRGEFTVHDWIPAYGIGDIVYPLKLISQFAPQTDVGIAAVASYPNSLYTTFLKDINWQLGAAGRPAVIDITNQQAVVGGVALSILGKYKVNP